MTFFKLYKLYFFRSLSLFYHKELEILVLFMEVFSSSCKHNGALFYQHRGHFFQIFFFTTLHVGRIAEETCPLSLKWFQDQIILLFKLAQFCVMKNYDQKLFLVISKLILAEVRYIYNFIRAVIYQRRPPCSFVNLTKFLKNFRAGSGYGAITLCAFVVIFTLCFQFYIFRTFETAENLLKLAVDKPCDKVTNEMWSLEIWRKNNSLCQA